MDGALILKAPKVERTISIHGRKRIDYYDWMRDRNDTRVQELIRAENAHCTAHMQKTKPVQDEIFEELKRRSAALRTDVQSSQRFRYSYYTRQRPDQSYPVYCRQCTACPAQAEEIILDPNRFSGQVMFGVVDVSPDENILVYSVDTCGAEQYTLHFVHLRTGQELPDVIEDTIEFAWGNDSRTVFYCTMNADTRPYRVYKHVLGHPRSEDQLVYEEPSDTFHVTLQKSNSEKYIFIKSTSYTSAEVRAIDADLLDTPRVILPRKPHVEYSVEHNGEYFYILTNEDAEEFRLIRAPVSHPTDRSAWEELMPHDPKTQLQDVVAFEKHIVVLASTRKGVPEIRIMDITEKPKLSDVIRFDEASYSLSLSTHALPLFRPHRQNSHSFHFTFSSLRVPPIVYAYDFESKEKSIKRRTQIPDYNPEDFELSRLEAPSTDGVSVPITLIHRKGLSRNGDNPCLLFGYGAYGSVEDMDYQMPISSLVQRGLVYAVAHVRGGAFLGRNWYAQGKLLRKMKGLEDLIACTDHLFEQGITRPQRLAVYGRSAGGVLVGASTNLWPDRFALMVAEVPFLDCVGAMLDPHLPLTLTDREEFGDPNDPRVFDYQMTYSPYDTVRAQNYPHVLLIGGYHDPRVQFWEPLKMAAKLRDVKLDDKPVLCRILPAGHYGSAGQQGMREIAEKYAWILHIIYPEYQSPNTQAVSSETRHGP